MPVGVWKPLSLSPATLNGLSVNVPLVAIGCSSHPDLTSPGRMFFPEPSMTWLLPPAGRSRRPHSKRSWCHFRGTTMAMNLLKIFTAHEIGQISKMPRSDIRVKVKSKEACIRLERTKLNILGSVYAFKELPTSDRH